MNALPRIASLASLLPRHFEAVGTTLIIRFRSGARATSAARTQDEVLAAIHEIAAGTDLGPGVGRLGSHAYAVTVADDGPILMTSDRSAAIREAVRRCNLQCERLLPDNRPLALLYSWSAFEIGQLLT